MLMIVENGIRGGICHSIYRYVKANDEYMKNYDKKIELSYLKYQYINNLYGWAMSQKLLVNSFKWVEETPQFNEYFITLYNEDNDIKYFIKADVQYPEKLHEFYNSLP